MRIVKMMVDFLKKFLLLSLQEQKTITHIRADVGRKREFRREDGFIPALNAGIKGVKAYIYEPSMDERLKKLRQTGPYFRIWFTIEKDDTVYFVDFEKLS